GSSLLALPSGNRLPNSSGPGMPSAHPNANSHAAATSAATPNRPAIQHLTTTSGAPASAADQARRPPRHTPTAIDPMRRPDAPQATEGANPASRIDATSD